MIMNGITRWVEFAAEDEGFLPTIAWIALIPPAILIIILVVCDIELSKSRAYKI